MIIIIPYSESKWSTTQRVSLEDHQLKFGMAAPTFTPINNRRTITNRRVSTIPLDPNPPAPQLSYTLITANPPDCLNTDPSFTASPPLLEYRQGTDQWRTLNYRKEGSNIISVTDCKFLSMTPKIVGDNSFTSQDNLTTTFMGSLDKYSDFIQFRFIQLDHRGGFCDCWAVAGLTITYLGYRNTLK